MIGGPVAVSATTWLRLEKLAGVAAGNPLLWAPLPRCTDDESHKLNKRAIVEFHHAGWLGPDGLAPEAFELVELVSSPPLELGAWYGADSPDATDHRLLVIAQPETAQPPLMLHSDGQTVRITPMSAQTQVPDVLLRALPSMQPGTEPAVQVQRDASPRHQADDESMIGPVLQPAIPNRNDARAVQERIMRLELRGSVTIYVSSQDRMARKYQADPICLLDTIAGRYVLAEHGQALCYEPGTPGRIHRWLATRLHEVGR